MTKTLKPGDFLKALAEGSLVETITREGVAMQDPDDPGAILFSDGGSCGPWSKVPVEVVECVEFLHVVPCKDHEHPFVRLHVKDPPKNDTVAAFFAGLARRSIRSLTIPPFPVSRTSGRQSSSRSGSGTLPILQGGMGEATNTPSSFSITVPFEKVGDGYFHDENITIDQNGNYYDHYSVHCSTSGFCYCSFQQTITLQDENHNFIATWSWTLPPNGNVLSPGQDGGPVNTTSFLQEIKNRYWDIRHYTWSRVFHKTGLC
jgi:hypothetical protein